MGTESGRWQIRGIQHDSTASAMTDQLKSRRLFPTFVANENEIIHCKTKREATTEIDAEGIKQKR